MRRALSESGIRVGVATLWLYAAAIVGASGQDRADQVLVVGAAGDFGVGGSATATLAAMGAGGLDIALALGDLSYNGPGSEQSWCAYVGTFFPDGFPFEIVTGNHEDDFGEDGHIGGFTACLPDRLDASGVYGVEYTFDYGTLARFILISPDRTVNGEHYYYGERNARIEWLAATIDEARASGAAWVIVGMHASCLSMGPYYCAPYQDLWDLLVEKQVDLVLHGHDHSYQRTHQLATGPGCARVEVDAFDADCISDGGTDGAYTRGAGTISIVAGTGGGDLYDLDTEDSEAGYFARWMGANATPRNGFLKITITGETLSGEFIGTTPTSDFTDRFEIR